MVCKKLIELPELVPIAREWEKKVFVMNDIFQNSTSRYCHRMTTAKAMTQFDRKIILVSSKIAEKSDMNRLVANVLHEMVHSHLYLSDPKHLDDHHGVDFKRLRQDILERFDIDIDHRSEWSVYEQCRFYEWIYTKWRCKECGYVKAYRNTTRKPNGVLMDFHEVGTERRNSMLRLGI